MVLIIKTWTSGKGILFCVPQIFINHVKTIIVYISKIYLENFLCEEGMDLHEERIISDIVAFT